MLTLCDLPIPPDWRSSARPWWCTPVPYATPVYVPDEDPYVLRWRCTTCRACFLTHGPVAVRYACPTCGGRVTMTGEVWDMRQGMPRWLRHTQHATRKA